MFELLTMDDGRSTAAHRPSSIVYRPANADRRSRLEKLRTSPDLLDRTIIRKPFKLG
jgi:hypothetical protein